MRRNYLIQINRIYSLWLVLLFLSTLLLLNIGITRFDIFRHVFPQHFSQTMGTKLPHCTDKQTRRQMDFKNDESKVLNIEVRGSYIVINRYIEATYHSSLNSSVTLCTQSTIEFLHHIAILCERWQSPLSVAVYAPGQDFHSAIKIISHLRHCGPKCVIMNVTWHMIYDNIHSPPGGMPVLPEHTIDCSKEITTPTSYREKKKLTYPINVARNVAKLNSNTHYLFVSDIELYPSLNIVPRFLKMVTNQKFSLTPHVYVLPPFEIKKGLPIPSTKSELVNMITKKQAIFFHKYACDICHKFPHRERWLKVIPPEKSMNIFHTTKGSRSWEPFYIGTINEPLFDERFTWEGKNNKLSHTQLLCFMDYDMHILDNAFLIHSPGIKTTDIVNADHKKRSKHLNHNNVIYNELKRNLQQKYPNRTNC